MKITTSYNVRMKTLYVQALKDTSRLYTQAVSFFINVVLQEWDIVTNMTTLEVVNYIQEISHITSKSPYIKYPFDKQFPKFPVYLRRAAISCALGKCHSYKSNLENWEAADPATRGKTPSVPTVRNEMPAFYKGNMFEQIDDYHVKLKLFYHNDWQYVKVALRKSDVDYLLHHCAAYKTSSPVLRHEHKVWELCFSYEEEVSLRDTPVKKQKILAVDLGINNPCTCNVMTSDGTVLSRHFYQAPVEEDSLNHKLNKIKKAQQYGSRKMPKKWAAVKGINTVLARNTAHFIVETAVSEDVDVIVMEHLDMTGKIHGSKKQRLHMWKRRAVQKQVLLQAHRHGIRVRRVCAYKTSKLAFDGSGDVLRGKDAGFDIYSMCKFTNGKQYNCDLNASYNIGARYFIREILKSFSEKKRLSILAKVPECDKRSTCTLASLIKLNAALSSNDDNQLSLFCI